MQNMKPIPLQIFEGLRQDPSTVFDAGQVNVRTFNITQGGYSLEVADAGVVELLIGEFEKYYNKEVDELHRESETMIKSLIRQLHNEKSKYETLKRNLQEEHDRRLSEYQHAIEENKRYVEWYGKRISPILIIRELWNNGSVGKLGNLIPPTSWKTGTGLGGEAGARAIRYWMSELEEWKFFQTFSKGVYIANIGMYEALSILHDIKSKKGLKTKIEDLKGEEL